MSSSCSQLGGPSHIITLPSKCASDVSLLKEMPCPRDNSNIDGNMVYLSLPSDPLYPNGPLIRSNCRWTLPRNKNGHILSGCYTETPFCHQYYSIFNIHTCLNDEILICKTNLNKPRAASNLNKPYLVDSFLPSMQTTCSLICWARRGSGTSSIKS